MRVAAIRLGAWMLPACLLAGSAAAQTAAGNPAASARPAQNTQLRSQISILEAVLERSVQEGVSRALGEVSKTLEKMPGFVQLDVPIWSGRARGFHVDNYGVFFDVDVPDLPLNTTWSVQMVTLNDQFFRSELSKLSDAVAAVTDSRQRAVLESALARLQRATGADSPASPPGLTRVANPTQPPDTRPAAPSAQTPPSSAMTQTQMRDLDAEIRGIYRAAMQEVLIDTMLDQGRMLQIGPDERLTLAARVDRSGLAASKDPTAFLTIRGRDLAALNAGRITREEAKKLIEVVWK